MKQSLIIFLITSLATMWSTHVAADFSTTFPGTACKTTYGNPNYVSGAVRPVAGTAGIVVECPLARQNPTGYVRLAAVRTYSTKSIGLYCRFSSASFYGSVLKHKYNFGSGQGYDELRFIAPPDYNNGAFHLYCSLPGQLDQSNPMRSTIFGYQLIESE